MKKKILIIILPIVLVLIVLTGILLYVYLPPKDSNFRIDLQVDDIGFDDEITLVSDDKSATWSFPAKREKRSIFGCFSCTGTGENIKPFIAGKRSWT